MAWRCDTGDDHRYDDGHLAHFGVIVQHPAFTAAASRWSVKIIGLQEPVDSTPLRVLDHSIYVYIA